MQTPLYKLPNEILALIFEETLHLEQGAKPTILTLCSLSQRLRAVAIGTGTLWTIITTRFPGNWHLIPFELFSHCFERSGVLELDVTISVREADEWFEHLSLVLTHLHRVQSLTFHSDSNKTLASVLEPFQRVRAPNLTSLRIGTETSGFRTHLDISDIFLGGTPLLRRFHLHGHSVSPRLPIGHRTVTHLAITKYTNFSGITREYFEKLIVSYEKLTSLKVTSELLFRPGILDRESLGDSVIHLPNITDFSISFSEGLRYSLWSRLATPNIQTLCLTGTHNNQIHAFLKGVNYIPRLEHLHTLVISPQRHSCCSPNCLSIRVSMSFLAAVSAVNNLTLRNICHLDDFLRKCLFFPELKVLSLDYSNNKFTPKVLREVLAFRVQNGVPIQRVSVADSFLSIATREDREWLKTNGVVGEPERMSDIEDMKFFSCADSH